MPTDQPADTLLAQFFDALPYAAIYLEAVRDEQEQLIDLLLVQGNQKGRLLVGQGIFHANVGERILRGNPERERILQPLFHQYATLLKTGITQEFDYLNPVLHRVVHVSRSRMGDGALVVVRDPVEHPDHNSANEELTNLLSGILEASLNGIITYESIRNNAGGITDFRFVRLNQAAMQMLALTAEVVGKPMIDQLPGVKESGLFDQFVAVVETGQSSRFEIPFPVGDELLYYDMSVVKLGDGFVITFNNVTASKQATLAIEQQAVENRRQAELLSSVLDGATSGIKALEAVRDPSGQIDHFIVTVINKVGAELFGWRVEDVIGKRVTEVFPGIDEMGLIDRYSQVTQTRQPQRLEFFYGTDGNGRWLDLSLSPFGDGLAVTYTDISERKQAAADLEKQKSLLNSVLNSSVNGIMAFEAVRDSSGQIVDFVFRSANEASCRMTSRTADELIGQKLLDVFPGNVESGLFAMYVQTTETGEPGRKEVYYNHDGLDFWLDISSRKLGDGFVVTFSDVSIVKQATKVVEQSAAELQTVIDTSQTGIFLFTPVHDESGEVVDFRFRVANRQLASYVGQRPEVVVGALGSIWFPGYKTNGLFDSYKQTYLTGEQRRFDFHYNSDGIDVWLDIMATKLGNEVLVTFGDYTPLKQLQQQLQESVIDLQRSNRNLEQFAYVASHDLQEPLRKIQAFADILQTQYAPAIGEQGVDMLRRMQSAANRMQVLIRDVLAYSRIATKRDAVGPVDLSELVNDVLGDLETVIADKQAIIGVGALPTVTGDSPQLQQLFQNLISNSLKFTRPSRIPELSLTCQTLRGRDARIAVSGGDENRVFHQIELKDNGIGFDPHQAERIFQVFQRLHGRSEYQGTGIGLAIVQKVIENHQGYISADGRPGEGATFTLLLPA